MIFRNMKESLEHYGFGELKGRALYHAYGRTAKGIQVWLPILLEAENHVNIPKNINGEDLILQRDKIENDNKQPNLIAAHVITREDKDNEKNYEYIGIYKPVLCDKDKKFTVHVKVPLFTKADGASKTKDTLTYDTNYTATPELARLKIEELWKVMKEEQKKLGIKE